MSNIKYELPDNLLSVIRFTLGEKGIAEVAKRTGYCTASVENRLQSRKYLYNEFAQIIIDVLNELGEKVLFTADQLEEFAAKKLTENTKPTEFGKKILRSLEKVDRQKIALARALGWSSRKPLNNLICGWTELNSEKKILLRRFFSDQGWDFDNEKRIVPEEYQSSTERTVPSSTAIQVGKKFIKDYYQGSYNFYSIDSLKKISFDVDKQNVTQVVRFEGENSGNRVKIREGIGAANTLLEEFEDFLKDNQSVIFDLSLLRDYKE